MNSHGALRLKYQVIWLYKSNPNFCTINPSNQNGKCSHKSCAEWKNHRNCVASCFMASWKIFRMKMIALGVCVVCVFSSISCVWNMCACMRTTNVHGSVDNIPMQSYYLMNNLSPFLWPLHWCTPYNSYIQFKSHWKQYNTYV